MILYLLKSSTCLVLLLIIYHLLLEQEKMLKFNRFYLLASLVFALLIPLIEVDFAYNLLNEPESNANFEAINFSNHFTQGKEDTSFFLLNYIITGIYFTGAALMLFRFVKNLLSLTTLKKKGIRIRKKGYSLVLVEKLLPPHSFFNTMYLNRSLYEHKKVDACVIQHELSHIKQKHSLDIFFIELVQLVFWFNPVLFFYKKAIKLNHEFLADADVLATTEDSSTYINTLLKTIFRNNPSYLASSINYSLTKKRFIMMTKTKSRTKMLVKQVLLAPLFICFVFLFSDKVEAQEKGASRELMKEYTAKTKDNIIKMKDVKRLEYIYSLMSDKQKKSVNAIPPPPPKPGKKSNTVNKEGLDRSLIDNFPEKPKYFIDGKEVTQEKVLQLKKDRIKSINVKKKEGTNGAVYIQLKE